MTLSLQNNHEILYYTNGDISNRVIKYSHDNDVDQCVFVPNWRAKPHHWSGFISAVSQYLNIDYFETREKMSTISSEPLIDFRNEQLADDIIQYINTQVKKEYHLILCSFSTSLVISHWDRLNRKPKSLVLVCPISCVSLPWIVRLFTKIPNSTVPFLYKIFYKLARKSKAVRPICKNMETLIKDGNIFSIRNLHSSVKHVLKLKIPIFYYKKVEVPTLIIKANRDKIHPSHSCHLIHQSIPNSILEEVDSFKEAHSEETAKKVYDFIYKLKKEHS